MLVDRAVLDLGLTELVTGESCVIVYLLFINCVVNMCIRLKRSLIITLLLQMVRIILIGSWVCVCHEILMVGHFRHVLLMHRLGFLMLLTLALW